MEGSGCVRAPKHSGGNSLVCNKVGKGISGKEETQERLELGRCGWELCLVARMAHLPSHPEPLAKVNMI